MAWSPFPRVLVTALFLLTGSNAALGQTAKNPANDDREVQLSDAEQERLTADEIVVTGIRLIQAEPPTDARTVGVDVSASRGQFLRAEQFARCADTPRVGLLRKVIDGPPNDAETRHALDKLIRINLGCYPDYPQVARSHPPELGTCHGEMAGNLSATGLASVDGTPGVAAGITGRMICRALYTRGAIVERVLLTYAPDLQLTREQTWRHDVRRRFNARERERNEQRFERDYLYFKVASCLVQAVPELSTLLIRSEPAGKLSTRIQETMFARAPSCIGHARSVKADPTQFRIYIADAVYRWLVAARDVDSLIPSAD